MKTAVMILKVGHDKASMEVLAYQVSQITVYCIRNNLKLIGCVITFQGAKDLIRGITVQDRKQRFDVIVSYSPHQLFKSKEDYVAFTEHVSSNFKCEVVYLRE